MSCKLYLTLDDDGQKVERVIQYDIDLINLYGVDDNELSAIVNNMIDSLKKSKKQL